MDHNLRIVIVDGSKGGPKVTYLGTDAAEAETVFEDAAANVKNEAVRLFVYPHAARLREPASEAAQFKLHQANAEKQIDRANELALKSAQDKADKAAAELAALQEKLNPAPAAPVAEENLGAEEESEKAEAKPKKKTAAPAAPENEPAPA